MRPLYTHIQTVGEKWRRITFTPLPDLLSLLLSKRRPMSSSQPSVPHDLNSLPFATHIDTVPHLLKRATRAPTTRELVLTPTQLHRRNLRDRLRRNDAPQSVFQFAQPLDVARQLADEQGVQTECLNRIDRLHHLETALQDARNSDQDWYADLAVSMGTDLVATTEAVERLRAEVGTTTGFHPERLAALRDLAAGLDSPAREDALARIAAAVTLQQDLAERGDDAPTNDAITRRATRELAAEGQSLWSDSYANIERITVAGVSTLGATLIDFLATIGRESGPDVEVHLHLRHATGDQLNDRLIGLSSIDTPGRTVIDG